MAFSHFKVGFGEGELGADGNFRVVIPFGKRLDLSVRSFADRHESYRRLVLLIIIPRPNRIAVDDGEALELDVVVWG